MNDMTPDWSLSDLSDETVERIANEVDLRAQGLAKAGDYYGATNLATAAEIIRDWLERRYERDR